MEHKERIVVFSIGFILLSIFTFTDLQISMLLFTKNSFGRVFEVIGEIPFVFLTLTGCCLLFRFRPKRNVFINFLSAIFFALFIGLFTFMGGFMTLGYLRENMGDIPSVFGVIIGGVLLGSAILFAYKIPKDKAHKAVSFGIIALVYFLLVIVVMNTIKMTWGRMRIREMIDPVTQFTRWYIITNRGGFDNVYASFPSGHSMNSAAIILSLLLPSFVPKLVNKEKVIKILVYTWLLLVGSSRVVMGAHFPSDVVAGVMLSLALFEITRLFITKIREKQ